MYLDVIIFISGGRCFYIQDSPGCCDYSLQYQQSVLGQVAFDWQERGLVVTLGRLCIRGDNGSDGCFCHAGCGLFAIVADATCYVDPGDGSWVYGGDGKCWVVTEWTRAMPKAPCPVIDNSRFAGTHRYGVGAAFSDAFVRASFSKNIFPWAQWAGVLYRSYIATDSIAKPESG